MFAFVFAFWVQFIFTIQPKDSSRNGWQVVRGDHRLCAITFSLRKKEVQFESIQVLTSFPGTNNKLFCLLSLQEEKKKSRIELWYFKWESTHCACVEGSHVEIPHPVLHAVFSEYFRIVPLGLSQLQGDLFSNFFFFFSNLWYKAVEIIQHAMLHGSPCPERAHGPWNSMEVVCVLSKTLINIPKHLSPHQVFEIPPPLAFPSSLWIQTLSCYSSQKSLHDLKAKIPLHFHDLQLAPRGSDWKAQFPLTWLHISLLHPIFPEPPQYVLGTFSILLFWLHPSGASCILPFVDQPLTSPPALGTPGHTSCAPHQVSFIYCH